MFKRAARENKSQRVLPDQLPCQTADDLTIRGWAFYGEKDYPRAEADLRAALRLDMNNLDAYYALGLTLKASGQKEAAAEAFRQAATLAQYITDSVRGRMVHRLALGQIHEIETGDWNLEKEIWLSKR